ncbi:MAG TPA: prepilin-type N-terminal cleavage/methylation domain-containing protein [Candidatus Eisenbacteria bacterium]|jgi:prepilin-type N-terminal cleavage/methylation domain-containing protein|nr:prepilin-type N-terminal cleavage/methylation domain-containing protein [Candidatus Eisenbacteria bacterium]
MKTKIESAFTLLEIMIVVAIIGILAAMVIPSLRRSIETARKQACAVNRKNIDGVKLQWAAENKLPLTAVPTDADLFGKSAYIEHKPDCPAGGAYSLNSIEAKCTCNFPVHVD